MVAMEKVKLALLAMQRHNWEHGTTMQAFFEQGDDDVVIALAKEAAYRRIPDGRVAMLDAFGGATDPCSAGEALQHAMKLTGDPELTAAHEGLLDWALNGCPRNAEGIAYHVTNKPEFWVDSMYMFPPYLAAVGHPKEAMKQIRGWWKALFDTEKRMLSHIWHDGDQTFTRKALWGVGNGWTVAGLARVIDLLPEDMADEKKELIGMATELIDTILGYRTDDWHFYDVIDDPSTFVETNLGQMVAYGIFRGVASGWLPKERLEEARKLQQAARGKVDQYGLVQDVCGAPRFDRAGVAAEGQSFYLLMEAAAAKCE